MGVLGEDNFLSFHKILKNVETQTGLRLISLLIFLIFFIGSSSAIYRFASEVSTAIPKDECLGTWCDFGCCPEANWVCCEGTAWCADMELDCPPFLKQN